MGIALPLVDFLSYWNRRSWGVQFVAVLSRDLMEWRASAITASHSEVGSPLVFRASVTARQIVPLQRSTWPLPRGLYGVVRLVAIPRDEQNCVSSSDMNELPRSEWI